jgi:hypothetical protein
MYEQLYCSYRKRVTHTRMLANILKNNATMKISVKSENHKGIQPIRVLQHNIVYRYENTNSDFLKCSKEIMDNKGLQPGISYFIFEEPINYSCKYFRSQTPFVDGNKKIGIHETFLSYIWINCFSLWVLYDEAVAKPMQNAQARNQVNIINTDLINLTQELFQYGKSLITVYSPWDKSYFPNPEEYSKEDEFYVLRANGLFTYAVNFILCHEFAHVEQEHIDTVKKRKVDDTERKLFEKEADDRAIELMLSGKDGENDKSLEFGVLIGLASMLFFRKTTYGGDHHPDTDNRIQNYLEKLNAPYDHPIWGGAALALKLWDNQFNLSFNWPSHANDFKEIFYGILEQIEKQKNVC